MSDETKHEHDAPAAPTVLDFSAIKEKAASTCGHVDVWVESWEGHVRLKKLGAIEGIELSRAFDAVEKDDEGQPREDKDLVEFYARLLKLSIVGADGQHLMNHSEGGDFLANLPFDVLNVLGFAALTLNGFAKVKEAGQKK